MISAQLDEDEALPRIKVGRPILQQVIWLALPVFIEQSLYYLVLVSDTVLTGRYLNLVDLAAVTNGTYFLWVLGSLMIVVSAGATALVSRRVGEADFPAAVRTCRQAMGLALIVGSAISVVGLIASSHIVWAMGLRGEAAVQAANFLRIILAITPLLALENVGVASLRGAGDTRTGMYVMLVINIVNAMLSWSLVTGFRGLPKLGLAGVAIGTAVGEGLGGLIVISLLFRGRSGLSLTWKGMWPHPDDVRRLLKVSLPAAGESLTNSFCQLWFLSLINAIGLTAAAAHGVALRCEAIAFLTVQAFSVAASTLTGQYLGAGQPALAAKAAKTAWGLGVLVISLFGLLLYWKAPAMFTLFLKKNQPGVAEMGVPVLRIVAFAFPFLATIVVLSGSLRGAGDTKGPWLIVILGYLMVRIPLTYLLTMPKTTGGWGLGLKGAWIAMLADLMFRGSLVAARFLQGKWQKIRV